MPRYRLLRDYSVFLRINNTDIRFKLPRGSVVNEIRPSEDYLERLVWFNDSQDLDKNAAAFWIDSDDLELMETVYGV